MVLKRRYRKRNPGQTGRRNNYPDDYENDSDDSNLKRKADPSPNISRKKSKVNKQKVLEQPLPENLKKKSKKVETQPDPISEEVIMEDDSFLEGMSQQSIHTIGTLYILFCYNTKKLIYLLLTKLF